MTKKAAVRWGMIGVIILFVIGMIAFPQLKRKWSAADEEAPAGPPAVGSPRAQVLNINAEVLRYRSLTDKTVSIGSAIPDEDVNLSFESSGKVVAIYFTEGTHVKAGDLLAKINDKPLQAQLKKLEAQVPLATDRVFRQRTLLEKDAVSQEAYESVTTEYEKLMADIELVKANIAQTELRAPFDGIVGLRTVSEGAYVTQATMIVKLTKISPIKIEFSINERYASDVRDGTPIQFSRRTADGKIKEYTARVYALESDIDITTRTLKLRAVYPNVNEEIKPGMFLSVEVTKQEIRDALSVPSEAIIPEMGKNMVYLYKNGVAQPVEIQTGLRTESHVQAIEGVSEGDTLITTGVMQLRTGMKVSIDNLN